MNWNPDFTEIPEISGVVLFCFQELNTEKVSWGLGLRIKNEIIGRGFLNIDWNIPLGTSNCGKYKLTGWSPSPSKEWNQFFFNK